LFPRLWKIDDPNILKELVNLLDYQHTQKLLKRDNLNSNTLIRRKREKNWLHLLKGEDNFGGNFVKTSSLTSKNYVQEHGDLLLGEANKYRISKSDFIAMKELIVYLQKHHFYKESLNLIKKFRSDLRRGCIF